MMPKWDANDNSRICPVIPASSRSILELLLRQSLSSPSLFHRKLYCITHCLDDTGSMSLIDRFDDNDATIFHNVDVVLGHYAPQQNRINPFSSWSGAGDKGNISKDCSNTSSADPSFLEFYLTKILKMKPEQTGEGQVYRGGTRMKRGHKIASSLLKWARYMQLSSVNNESDKRANFPVDNCHGMGLRFDHEQTLYDEPKTTDSVSPQNCQYIYFVSEVMRLLAARWRECGAKKTIARQSTQRGTPKRRGRPPKSLAGSNSNKI
mmetsp:Transcript_39375/g.82328  ORF Transcript_39375/g.82328 Transcript_39375/m.82328 type:complete len:264 (-) Transcript_39375:167-958(-)